MLFMKGTPQPASLRLLNAHVRLNALGVKYAALDILPDPRHSEELVGLSGWPTIRSCSWRRALIGGCDIVMTCSSRPKQRALGGAAGPRGAPAERSSHSSIDGLENH